MGESGAVRERAARRASADVQPTASRSEELHTKELDSAHAKSPVAKGTGFWSAFMSPAKEDKLAGGEESDGKVAGSKAEGGKVAGEESAPDTTSKPMELDEQGDEEPDVITVRRPVASADSTSEGTRSTSATSPAGDLSASSAVATGGS